MDEIERMFSGLDTLMAGAKESQLEREGDRCRSEWVAGGGEDNLKRVTMTLTLQEILGPFSGQYGDRFGYVFTEGGPGQSCNTVIWWTTSKPPLEKGESGEFKVSITKFDEYSGKKQTVIQRLKPINETLERAKARRDAEADDGQDDD